jgi:hypothetical protein
MIAASPFPDILCKGETLDSALFDQFAILPNCTDFD